ncbi:MAG TPA: hypothetical protein VFE62_17900 [Gemmataceae bacterium]|nr:hypothetical protein [Gemmataceae bacterium]
MRMLVALLVVAAWSIPSFAVAQEKKFQPPEVKKIQIGFKTFGGDDDQTAFKVGLWTPIYVDIFGGTDGVMPKPGTVPPYLKITAEDSEDVGTEITVPVNVEPMKTRTFIGYIKTGRIGNLRDQVTVNLYINDRSIGRPSTEQAFTLQVDQHLYVTLGSRMADVHRAVRNIDRQREKGKPVQDEILRPFETTSFRNAVFENQVPRLPERWFGYNSIDMMILGTENRKFLTDLNLEPDRLSAIATWVRRGGRLVVPIAPANQDVVTALLSNAVWQPPIPVVPPAGEKPIKLDDLAGLATWGNVQAEPFIHKDPKDPRFVLPIRVAPLEPPRVRSNDWEPGGYNTDKPGAVPLYAHVRYGLGRITYIAISLEDTSFFQWKGKQEFLENTLKKLAPTTPANVAEQGNIRFGHDIPNDITTDLVNQLDEFDVRIIEFGYVALFIVLYILVVGPLDFVLLKYVFKRLEWTWITFPAVVLAVSVIAYFAAYALKGRDLKINKVDLIDFDMRTDVDAKGKPKTVRAYGASFFTILSPRIQNYTVGMEANPLFWGEEVKKVKHEGRDVDEVMSVDLLSWLGRPSGGPHDMGRGGGAGGFFRRPYAYRDDASGLEGVPIPVWTTKAFTASWERPVAKPPFDADLYYHVKDPQNRQIKLSGKLDNHLGVDLTDVWLVYDQRCYPIAGGLKTARAGSEPKKLELTQTSAKDLDRKWADMTDVPDAAVEARNVQFRPIGPIKHLVFHERTDVSNVVRNHLFRPLDLGWRVDKAPLGETNPRTREAILFARVRFVSGSAEALTSDATNPLPTRLWLGDLPNSGRPRPGLDGILNQDTFIRVILPVRPADE